MVRWMRWIIWLGIMPLYFGVKLSWKWVITDRHQWGLLPEGYRRALPIRLLAAAGLIAIGVYLSRRGSRIPRRTFRPI